MGEAVTTAVTDLFGLTTTVIDYVTKNAVLAVCFVSGTVVPAGIAIFHKLKHRQLYVAINRGVKNSPFFERSFCGTK